MSNFPNSYHSAIGVDSSIDWQMEPGEQAALVAMLAGLRPQLAIEIGSRYGGSLQVLSRYAERVISLDIDPTCHERLGPRFQNAEFITGDSSQTFRPLLRQLELDKVSLGFILIDGDHSARGVQRDIECLLKYQPLCPLFVVMHDSFNPNVRHGIRDARWSESRFVHSVELDYIPGILASGGEENREMWGGFALAILLPEPRTSQLVVTARMQHMFTAIFRNSVHWFFDPKTLTKRCSNKMKTLIRSSLGTRFFRKTHDA